MRKVLQGNMACLADFGSSDTRFAGFIKTGRPNVKSLIENLLLFDQITIPTNDYMPLAILIDVLGEARVLRMLEEDALKFARLTGSVAYAGGGAGVTLINVATDTDIPKFFSAPNDEAVRQILNGTQAKDKTNLAKLALRATSNLTIDEKTFFKKIYNEVGQNLSALSNPLPKSLNALPGLRADQVRALTGTWQSGQDDDIYQILRVAQACLESVAADQTNCDDIYTSDQVAKVYQSAMKRSSALTAQTGYEQLRTIADIPDVAESVLNDPASAENLFNLRNTNHGAAFRHWFHENCTSDPINTAKEYVKLLREVPISGSKTAKALRFLATTTVGVLTLPLDPTLGLATGTAASAVDAFLVDKVIKQASAKIFIDKLSESAPVK